MVGRNLGRVLVGLGLLCASLAWTGWVVLHTVADPSRSSRVAHAVLDDPEARGQVAGDLADSLADAVNAATATATVGRDITAPKIDGANPALRGAVDAALADPRVLANLVDAFSAEHANLLGVEPKRPAAIDTALLVDVASRALGTADAGLAAQLRAAAPASIPLPDVEIPFIGRVRRFMVTAVPRLGVLAVLLVAAALLVGDRGSVLRRVGGWAIGAGLLWAVGPRVLVWLAERFAPGNAAVVRAVLQGATGEITAAATVLALGGVTLVVLATVLRPLGGLRTLGDAGTGAGTGPGRGGVRSGIDARGADPRLGPRVHHWTHPGRRDDSWSAGWRSFTGRELPRDDDRGSGRRFDGRV